MIYATSIQVELTAQANHHEPALRFWCLLCNYEHFADSYIHPCTFGYQLGQVCPEMNPTYLIDEPW